jgi:hypothetical protein
MFEKKRHGSTGPTLFPFLAFLFFWVAVAQAADNAECLKCHGNPRLSMGAKDGSLVSLYVNAQAFRASVHGAAGIGCTDCHQGAKPSEHPAEGFPEANCATCHPDASEAYKKTTHGMLLASGDERAPRCQTCHTAHYVRKISDPRSPLSAGRLPQTCYRCHRQVKPPAGFFAELAIFRLQGHPKADLEYRYNTRACADCHPANTGHPQKEGPTPYCLKCHDPSLSTPLLLGPIHREMSFPAQPVPYILRILYGIGVIGGIVGGIVFWGYRTYRRKRARGGGAEEESSKGGGPSSRS